MQRLYSSPLAKPLDSLFPPFHPTNIAVVVPAVSLGQPAPGVRRRLASRRPFSSIPPPPQFGPASLQLATARVASAETRVEHLCLREYQRRNTGVAMSAGR